MIYSIADLLKEFSEKENQKLMEQITHRPTIGDMYGKPPIYRTLTR